MRNPPGDPMTLGNMRRLGVQRLVATYDEAERAPKFVRDLRAANAQGETLEVRDGGTAAN
jgi:hypothetical protein